jgi:hypothetical protein
MLRRNCGGWLSIGNSAFILRTMRSGWWIENGTAEPFFRNNKKWNLEFWGQMTGCLDFRVGKVFGVMDRGGNQFIDIWVRADFSYDVEM